MQSLEAGIGDMGISSPTTQAVYEWRENCPDNCPGSWCVFRYVEGRVVGQFHLRWLIALVVEYHSVVAEGPE